MSQQDRIETLVADTSTISPAQWEEIWTLTQEFYVVERGYVEAELRKRQRIALFRMNGAVLGMAAIDVHRHVFRGRKVVAIATSNVIIRENWRGRNLVQRLGFRTFLAARLRHPLRPIYWFFDTSSYKSYLLLPHNFRTWWPRFDESTPEPVAALMNELATRAYGPAWRPARGVVVRSGRKRMGATAAPLELTPESDPNLRFFATANPGHAEGDMLICLCPLTLANWLTLARHAYTRRRRRAAH
jgi:hypothetical protein